eukprot:5502837-Amphidinium_carterae.1
MAIVFSVNNAVTNGVKQRGRDQQQTRNSQAWVRNCNTLGSCMTEDRQQINSKTEFKKQIAIYKWCLLEIV